MTRAERADVLSNYFVGAPDSRLNQALSETIEELRESCASCDHFRHWRENRLTVCISTGSIVPLDGTGYCTHGYAPKEPA